MAEGPIKFVIVNNIPKSYKSADLRNFFTNFVETRGFSCFHFRHRPEVQKKPDSADGISAEKSRCVTSCCIVKVKAERLEELLKSYDEKHWTDKKEQTLVTRCFIKKIKIDENYEKEERSKGSTANKRGIVSSNLPIHQEAFFAEDLNAMIEMHPPTVMPNGNVGTPTDFFLKAIQACQLPPSLITKLGLQFPRNRSRRIYSNVPFEYGKRRRAAKMDTGKDHFPPPAFGRRLLVSRHKSPDDEVTDTEEDSEEEEWDREEALHDDVAGQERNKERLFEQEIELKWEKGGSGLVFYTDAQFWDAKDGDFDAKTADDWDIDTSIYRESTVNADNDARDLMQMRLEEHSRNESDEPNRLETFASFERYSTGFGRRILESQGWQQGKGVGREAAGIAEPLPNEGQHPRDKKGFGYHGEKLKRYPTPTSRRKRRFSDEDRVYIPTIFDEPEEFNSSESVLTSSFFSRLKYRTKFSREQSEDID